MIKSVSLTDNKIGFKLNSENDKRKQKVNEESIILPDIMSTRFNQNFDKTLSALTEYPAKGLKGDVNSDFYEFLSMGIIPYLAGSAMFMGLFNLVNKHLDPKSRMFASEKGKKMALGVVLYGLGKTFSKDLVTKPVAWSTGVDIELPYRNVYYPLPTKPGAEAEIFPQHQQRKVYDSSEFFRKDLLAKDEKYGVKYYDKIARKIGLGEDLNDSVTETTPIIQNIISTTKTAKTLSSYAWACAGVGLAMQNSWDDFFKTISNRRKHISLPDESFGTKISSKLSNMCKNSVDISKSFGTSFLKACKSMWTGENGTKGYMKHAGKSWIIFSTLLTVLSTANVIQKARQMGKVRNKELIDPAKESMVI